MKRILFILPMLAILSSSAKAQSTASASQTIVLELADAIELTFDATGTSTGSIVKFPFATMTQFNQGLQSQDYILTVRSNKKFNVAVNTNAPNFTYSGTISPAPVMPVQQVLSIMLTQNGTGGNVSSPFVVNQYSPMSDNTQTILNTCPTGNNQQLGVKYKATPRYSYPGGIYTIDAIYTATHM